MADNNFDILIRILTQQVGSEKATDILKKVREETTATGKEAVKQEEAVEAATKKTFASKHQLKDMVKQLGHEFPILGQVGRLALNPIAFTTAAITGAFVIWNKRVQDLSVSLGGIAMPDFTTSDADRIKNHAAAWGELAQKMADAASASNQIKTGLDDALGTIKANEELFRAMGIDTGTQGDQSRAAVKSAAAAALAASGRARIARAGTPGSTVKEEALGAQYSAAVAEAAKAKAEAQTRLMSLSEVGSGSILNPMRQVRNAQFLARYGNMSVEDAKALERGNIDSQSGIISRAGAFADSRASRATRRSEIAGGRADIAAAQGMEGEVVQLLRQIAAGVAGRAPMPKSEIDGQSSVALYQYLQNVPDVMAAIERANAAQLALLRNLSQRP